MGWLLEASADPVTPYVVGGTVLLGLLIALQFVRGLGKSRPHS